MPDITIDPQEVIDAFGSHYINEGQNMDNLHLLPFETFGTKEAFTSVETDQTVLREANVEVQEILQQYQDDFTPKGGVKFVPVMIPLYQMKIDVRFNPSKLAATWLGFLTTNKTDRSEWPFVKWLIEVYLMKQHDEDLENKAVYNGVYADPTQGTKGDADKVMDGINKTFADLITSGDLEVATMGVIPTAPKDFVTQIEDFIRFEVPEKYRYNFAMELNMSRQNRDKFKQGMRDKYNVNYQQTEQLLRVMDFENVSIAGRASMAAKNRYWMTPKFNALFATKGFSNKNAFQLEKQDRYVKIWTDWWSGLGFINSKLIFLNDQA